MITVYRRIKDSVVKEKLDSEKISNSWIDCFNPTPQELAKISKITGVIPSHFRERLVDYERPTTLETENYSLIVFGAPIFKKGRGEASSIAIFLCKNNNIVTLRTDEIVGLQKFERDITERNPKYLETQSLAVKVMMETIIDTYFEHFETFQESADRIEALIFKNPKREAIEETFKMRKSILFMHKALVANREVLGFIEKQNLSRIPKKDLPKFRDMREDILQLIDTEDTLRNVLTSILEIYTSSVSNQMNEVIKKLTVVASYVLIPTLIASIYGMNFKFMPEIPWKWGYPFSLALMGFSILTVYYYFKKEKML